MANFTCAEWAARAKSTTFARTAGGIICTTSPARDGLTPIERTDGATTFDSPFSADLLAVWDWESLFLPASGQGGRNLMAFQGILCAFPLFCGQDCPSCRLKLCPCAVLTARGHFAHKFLCTGAGEASPLLASARFELNRRPWRRSERRKARARPPCADAGGRNIPHRRTQPTRRRGRRAPKGAEGAHGAASGARTPTAGGQPPRQRRRQGARPARNRLWPTAKGRGRLCPCPR